MVSDKYKDKNVVWVLGSGFSRSLGGPLLYDLFTKKMASLTAARGRKRAHGDLVRKVFRNHRERGLNLWSHAEEFLDYIEIACGTGGSGMATLLHDKIQPCTMQVFRDECLRIVADECDFVEEADTQLEAWMPYRRFKSLLGPTHRIVSFNYDLVLEKLDIDVAHPQDRLAGSFGEPVFKLHGSISWLRNGKGQIVVDSNPTRRMEEGYTPVIGTPGPTKRKLADDHLRAIWSEAMSALAKADVVLFMGYRFPPSDAQSRAHLMEAIRNNTSRNLRIHTVLGPQTQHPDSFRLEKLLQHTLESVGRVERSIPGHPRGTKRYQIIAQPLYVEDFLTVIHDRELYGDIDP